MLAREAMELTKKYSTCPCCGNDKVGGEPSQGALIIEDEVFTRSCKCGWSVTVDRRIKHVATLTERRSGKLVGGVYEVLIHGQHSHKYLPLLELKEKSGVKRVDHNTKIEAWLNSVEGRKWALEVPAASVH
ncbi:MAG: DUF3797 domain-containing protein [Lysinibacillus sp.]